MLDVGGVGYEIEVPMTTLYRLPHLGEQVTLHTHLVVREDAHLLFGFYEKRDREMFRELIRLNGVGPKLALALMSTLEVDELVRCVQAQDTSALTRVPGVGKKTAERLLVELKDRFKAWDSLPGAFTLVSGASIRLDGWLVNGGVDFGAFYFAAHPQGAFQGFAVTEQNKMLGRDGRYSYGFRVTSQPVITGHGGNSVNGFSVQGGGFV